MKRTVWLTCVLAAVMLAFPTSAGADALVSTNGSGWIPGTAGERGSFGVFGAIQKDGDLIGQLVYFDHGVDFRVKSTDVTSYTQAGCQSTIQGTGESGSGPVEFEVTMTDGGEPGANDSFLIQVTGAFFYINSGILGGGNIQVHGMTCP